MYVIKTHGISSSRILSNLKLTGMGEGSSEKKILESIKSFFLNLNICLLFCKTVVNYVTVTFILICERYAIGCCLHQSNACVQSKSFEHTALTSCFKKDYVNIRKTINGFHEA